jgi:hypothetical protein
MAAGIRAFRKIQLVKESSPGTQVPTATARLIGTLGMQNDQKYYRPEDLETGKLSSFERSYVVGEQANLPFESDANYEQLAYLLGMSIKGGVTGGSPTDSVYTWTFLPNLTSLNSPDTYTIQYGDDVQAFISGFCYAPQIELSGQLDDAVKVKAPIVGQNVRTGSFTTLVNPTVLTPVIVGTGKLYVDSSWATLGNTNVAATLVDFDWKTVSKAGAGGINPIKYIDGNIYFSDRAEAKRHIELELTLAFTAATAGYFAAYIASLQTSKFIRIKFTGPLVGATAHDELDLDGNFIIDQYPTLTERDGQDVVKLKLVSQYDPTSTNEWQVILKNALGTMP